MRDTQIYNAIARDDVAYLTLCRYESNLRSLCEEEVHPMLQNTPSPLMVAAFFGSVKCFNYLFPRSDVMYSDDVPFVLKESVSFSWSLFVVYCSIAHYAAAGGNLIIMETVIEDTDADTIKAVDQYSNSPIHIAAKFGRTAIVKRLIDAEISPDCTNNEDVLFVLIGHLLISHA